MTGENIKANGRMANNMEMENSLIPENNYGKKEFGAKARG